MRHARTEDLDQLDALLSRLRQFEPLKERKRGVFYLKSKAFLHFHQDSAALFADARLGGSDFDRFRVSTKAEQQALLAKIARFLKSIA